MMNNDRVIYLWQWDPDIGIYGFNNNEKFSSLRKEVHFLFEVLSANCWVNFE